MLDEIKDVFEKINRDRYIIGFDLNDNFAQISTMRIDSNSPETVSSVVGEEEYNIPLCICKSNGRFYVGKDCLNEADNSGAKPVYGIYEAARSLSNVFIDGEEYAGADLLLLFIQKSLATVPLMTTPEKIAQITIAVRNADAELISVLKKLPELIKVSHDKLSFISYEEAFHYYMAFQNSELMKHNILLCDSSSNRLIIYRLERNRYSTPIVVMIDNEEYDEIDFKRDIHNEAKLDETFLGIIKGVCESKVYSGVYLIGEGFFGEWCRESLKYLCKGRRVFKGNNLFSKGACLAGREKVASTGLENKYKYLGRSNVKAEIGIKILRNGQVVNIPLICAGEQWFEAGKEVEILLKETDEIIVYLNMMGNTVEKTAAFKLEGLPYAKGRITKLLVSATMQEEKNVEFKVKDIGFGEIFPATGMEWVDNMELGY